MTQRDAIRRASCDFGDIASVNRLTGQKSGNEAKTC